MGKFFTIWWWRLARSVEFGSIFFVCFVCFVVNIKTFERELRGGRSLLSSGKRSGSLSVSETMPRVQATNNSSSDAGRARTETTLGRDSISA